MKLLISTMHKIILWDGQPNIVYQGELSEGFAHYNGITWDNSQLYITGVYDFRYCLYQFDPVTFNLLDLLFGELHEIHQIFYQNGKIYITNTGKNRIEIWDGKQWSWVAYNQSPCDIDHLNGIWSDGQRFYVSEFRHRVDKASVIRVCDTDLSLIETLEIGDPIHNVYVDNGNYYSLVSRNPGLVCRNREGLRHYPLPQLEGMLVRGLARSKDNWFVGASRWETSRDKRHIGDALVTILDNNFNEVDRIEIKDVGPVCDIRLIEPMGLSHNGIEYPGKN